MSFDRKAIFKPLYTFKFKNHFVVTKRCSGGGVQMSLRARETVSWYVWCTNKTFYGAKSSEN